MLLSNLSKVIRVNKTYNFNKNKYFSAITSNSKFTNNKTLFVYDKNTKVKKIYLDEVLKNKTPAIISNKYIKNLKIPQFVVSNINFETYSLLNKLYNNEAIIPQDAFLHTFENHYYLIYLREYLIDFYIYKSTNFFLSKYEIYLIYKISYQLLLAGILLQSFLNAKN